jgi:hypothetical protein
MFAVVVVVTAALLPLRGPRPSQGGLRAPIHSGGLRPADLALEQEPVKPVKEITTDMFGNKLSEGQNGLCRTLLIMIVAGIFAGCVQGCCGRKFNTCLKVLTEVVRIVGSVASIITLIYVFTNAHNGTRLWDQYDHDEPFGGLTTACYWVIVFAVIQLIQCACACCCVGLLTAVMFTAVMMQPHPTVEKMKAEIESARDPAVESILTPEFKQKCADMFKQADTNGDGSLDASELRAFAAASLPQAVNDPLFFEAFDQNGDRKLDAEEFQAMMVYFELKTKPMVLVD